MLSGADGAANEIALLTGGRDRPYVFGLATSLATGGATLDVIGGDEVEFEEFSRTRGLTFLNFRGSSRRDVAIWRKVHRIATYYLRLIGYTAVSRPKIFHILWNNKFEFIDRTLLMLYYRLLGKKVVMTVHNVNTKKRDLNDDWLNRFTLKVQYRLNHHLFVHTEMMKRQLIEEFGVPATRVSIIPFGINNAVPQTNLTAKGAKYRLGLEPKHRVILFFGRITPSKGIDWIIPVFRTLVSRDDSYRLIIAGRPDNCDEYWSLLRSDLENDLRAGTILLRDQFIPEEDVEMYFKGADVLILPYRDIYQSGVLFLGQSFGLPVLAADVGSLKDDVVNDKNGWVFEPENAIMLEERIERYFSSQLYAGLEQHRPRIREEAVLRHSWDVIARSTIKVYAELADSGLASASNDKPAASV